MKRLFFILAAVMMTASVMAEGHLKVKGVEIDGSVDTFGGKFREKGCDFTFTADHQPLILANIAGLDVMAYPLMTSQSQTVYSMVACSFYTYEEDFLRAQYNELQDLLAQKYGKEQEITIPVSYYPDPQGILVRGNATKALCYENNLGKIYMYMHLDEDYSGAWSITLHYIDKANEQLRLKEASDDI